MSVQRGFALIALLALAALISAFLIASALDLTSAGNSKEREGRSMSALRQAKAALIAYAANERWQAYKLQVTDQPGGLPCPDNNDTGASPGICSAAADRVGRLPWKTIGSEDLRDASGERLWYAVSSNFYKNAANIINSDTPGLLTIAGAAPASSVVAVVIAPGAALSGQDRIAQHSDPAAYLEGVTASTPDYGFNTIAMPSGTANDRLLVITQADLMAAVEPVVAARIEREVNPLLGDYFTTWGRYPFAAPFDITGAGPGREPQGAPNPPVDRTRSAYTGASPQTKGLLPVTNDPLTWSATVTSIVGQGTGAYKGTPKTIGSNPTICSTTSTQATCTINYGDGDGDDRPDIRIDVVLPNAGMAFADIPTPLIAATSLTIVDRDGNPLSDTAFGKWSAASDGIPPQFPPTQSNSFVLQAAGAVFTYTGRLQNSHDTLQRVTITIPLPVPSYLPRLTSPNLAWFISNQWYRQTYYAVSPGFIPGSGGACNPLPATPSCLKVSNFPVQNDNKRAILVFAGRALNGSSRPSASPANYLENANLTAALDTTPFVYEHRAGVPTTINDRVVVVSP